MTSTVQPRDVRLAAPAIVVVDGSLRAQEALAPAAQVAAAASADLRVVGVAERPADIGRVRAAIGAQLAEIGRDDVRLCVTIRSELHGELLVAANRGATLVLSAYGRWPSRPLLVGALHRLVAGGAPVVVGVGPRVAANWCRDRPGPIVCCVDDSGAGELLVEGLDRFIDSSVREVILVRIGAAEGRDMEDLAGRIASRHGVAVQALTCDGSDLPASIAGFAESVDANLLVTVSHHRPRAGRPSHGSVSMAVVAAASCPVAVLSPPRLVLR